MRNISNKSCKKLKTHILCSGTFSGKSCRLGDKIVKYGGATEDADNMAPARGILNK